VSGVVLCVGAKREFGPEEQSLVFKIVNRTVRELHKSIGRSFADWEDLRQELQLTVWQSLQGQEIVEKTLPKYVKLVAKRQAHRIIRRWRHWSRFDHTHLGEDWGHDDFAIDPSLERAFADLDARLDIEEMIAGFDARVQMMIRAMQTDTVAECARELKIRPTAIYKALKKLQTQFARAQYGETRQNCRKSLLEKSRRG